MVEELPGKRSSWTDYALIGFSNALRAITIPAFMISPFLGGFYSLYKVKKWPIHKPSFQQRFGVCALSFIFGYGVGFGCGLVGIVCSFLTLSTLENYLKE
jgi:ABC-type Fe3+ transport system permease subunit